MDVFALQNQLIRDYATYIKSFICIQDTRIRDHVEQELREGVLWPDPLIQLNPTFSRASESMIRLTAEPCIPITGRSCESRRTRSLRSEWVCGCTNTSRTQSRRPGPATIIR